jgi:hypothetical protein
MKSNSFLFLSLAAFFSASYLFGAGSQYVKAPIAPDNFNQVLSRDGSKPDAAWVYYDTISNRPVIGFVPHH